MFYSQTLLSKKGSLGAIRVAAYFFKRLKKPHVQLTDIASSVDTILQDEMHVLTYRVLGYLLLGIVRIYSKKVEYLFDDCQEVLIGVKNFVVHTKENLPVDTQHAPFFSITLPESFELDAFELEVVDVDDTTGGNVLPHEEITLKENAPEHAGTKRYDLEMCFCEEIADSHNTCSADYLPVEGVVSSYWMDVHLRNSVNIDSLIASMENLQENRPQEERVDLRMIPAVEKRPQNADRLYDEDNQGNREKIEDTQIVSSKDGIQGAASTKMLQDCVENDVNLVRSSGIERGPAENIQPDGEDIQTAPHLLMVSQLENQTCPVIRQDHNLSNISSGIEEGPANNIQADGLDVQIAPQPLTVSESEQLENETCQVTRQDHNLNNLQAETEKLRDNTCLQVEDMDIVLFESVRPQKHGEPFDEENRDDGEQRLPEILGSMKNHNSGEGNPLSIEVDRTTDIKAPDALGADTPQFISIRTPATKEYSANARAATLKFTSISMPAAKELFSTNARAATLKFTGIPTPATKEHALISRKRKCVYDDIIVLPNKVLKESINDASDLVSKRRKVAQTALAVWRASRMPLHGFFEPLIPCVSPELQSLFSEKKLKIITSVEKTVEPLKELDVPKIPTVGISEQTCIAPETPVQRKEVNIPEIPTVDISEQISIAPETPVQHSSFVKSFDGPLSPQTPNYDRVRAELCENVEQEPAPIMNQEPDLSPLDEVINSNGEDNNELDGWSGRTRKVAKYLHRSFLDQKERGEEEVVNLSRVVRGRSKKESARFFYEILVLSNKGCVDVKQGDSYGDILVRKLQSPNMEPNLWSS